MNAETATADDLLGLDVIDAQGNYLGIVDKVFIDPIHIELTGISVDKGFLNKGLAIGKSYIKRITKVAIFLSVTPAVTIKGMQVFSSDAKNIGVVQEVILEQDKNRIRSILVKTRRGTHTIQPKQIATIGMNVLLNQPESAVINITQNSSNL